MNAPGSAAFDEWRLAEGNRQEERMLAEEASGLARMQKAIEKRERKAAKLRERNV